MEASITLAQGGCRRVVTHKCCVSLPDPQQKLLIALITDITALREAKRLQQRSEEHFRALVDLLPQVVRVPNAASEVIEIGPTWTRLSGRPPEAAYGSGWEAAVQPEDLPSVRQQWRTSVATAVPLDVDCRERANEGAFRWVRNWAARRDAHGRSSDGMACSRTFTSEKARKKHGVKAKAAFAALPTAFRS
ncbi:PAS domain-containing protein [Pandoraea sputorum]|uniref:PAS domain-containing protein n=1 Tax=Pandoraea sputorum TaxID=93222 RepID=UPI00125766B0|nr:PAS domain-containing protein [Pandoraea sputorum]VVE54894.1 diguanylate cyclase [Pandoraea sputorum]